MATEIAKVRTREPEVRKDQLLDAAEKLFASKGFVETTVADIAEAAGVAKGTFYLYFPSKDHCVLALKKRLADGLVHRFLEVLAPEYERMGSGLKSIDVEGVARRLLDESFDYAASHAEVHRSLFHRGQSIEVDEVAMEAEEAIVMCLKQAFEMMNTLEVAHVEYPAHTARILFNGVHWALENALASGTDLGELKEAALEMIVRTLTSPARPASPSA